MKVTIAKQVGDLMNAPEPTEVITVRILLEDGQWLDFREDATGQVSILASARIHLTPESANHLRAKVSNF